MADPLSHQPVDHVLSLLRDRGHGAYHGEAVTQTEHALQAAWHAEKAGAAPAQIAAALLHDIGHLLHDLGEDCAHRDIDDAHEVRGARWLANHFVPEVVEPIRLHVEAKRYLCATEPGYHDRLSSASQRSLSLQGGPMTTVEAQSFAAGGHAAAAVALRHWDELAKIPGLETPDLEHFRPYLEATCVSD